MQLFGTTIACLSATAEAAHPKYHVKAADKYPAVDYEIEKFDDAISPKAVVISTFTPEAEVWHRHSNFTKNVTLPGLSPIYPYVYCTKDYELCNVITGEGEINAAASVTALLSSAQFNLTDTYFSVAGIAGIDPAYGTLGSAAFPRFTVQVGLQYEVDHRQAPSNWTTGYWPYGTKSPNQAPGDWYGTEVFELNEKLRDRAAFLASKANLTDSKEANVTRKLFNTTAALGKPKAIKCDSATSDVYFTGSLLDKTFATTEKNFTNGTATYCVTAQEDAAILEAASRNAKFGLTDFSRWVVSRTASDFDRAPPSFANNTIGFFNYNNTGGYPIALQNSYKAGYPFIKDVSQHWNSTYKNGTYIVNKPPLSYPVGQVNATSPDLNITVTNYTFVNLTSSINGTIVLVNGTNITNITNSTDGKNGTYAPQNYIGDVFGSLGGEPDFGPGKNHTFYQQIDF